MPDSGQSVFIACLERGLHSADSFKPPPFQFVPVPAGHQSRSAWPLEFQSRPAGICSFFFPDLSSGPSVLLSVRTFNWMRSQLRGLKPPRVVGFIRTASDLANFELFKGYLEAGADAATFAEGSQNDLQKFASSIQTAAAAAPP
jgi:hypothetical protein